jgi:hypothetical protein
MLTGRIELLLLCKLKVADEDKKRQVIEVLTAVSTFERDVNR